MMVPVIMEEALQDTRAWTGPVQGVLGNLLYVKMWEDGAQLEASVAQLAAEIRKRVAQDGAMTEENLTDFVAPIEGEATARRCAPSVVPCTDCMVSH
jgi:hypothetical protein